MCFNGEHADRQAENEAARDDNLSSRLANSKSNGTAVSFTMIFRNS